MKSIVESIWQADYNIVEYASDFLMSVITDTPFQSERPDFIPATKSIRDYLHHISGFFSIKEKNPFEAAEKRVMAALDQYSEWVVCNLAIHSKTILNQMSYLAWKWLWNNVLQTVASDRSEMLNFTNLSFSPCGFLITLIAAETCAKNNHSAFVLTEMFKRVLVKENDLRSGDIILIRVFDDFLQNESSCEYRFSHALLPFDTLKKIRSDQIQHDWEHERWWGMADLLKRFSRQRVHHMTAYICQHLCDGIPLKFETVDRRYLAKWSSCFNALMCYNNLEFEEYFKTLNQSRKNDIQYFGNRFLEIFKNFQRCSNTFRYDAELVNEQTDSFYHFYHWLHQDINDYVRQNSGDNPQQYIQQEIEKDYNRLYKFVFICLYKIFNSDKELKIITEQICFGKNFVMENPFKQLKERKNL